MDAKALTTAVITFSIVVVLFSSLLVPIIGDASSTTTSIENEGASWMRYDMKNSIVGTDISVTEDSGNITITNGTDSQSNELSDALIIYAGSNGSVYYDGTNMIVLSKNNDATTYGTLTGSFTVREINGSVIASDGTNTYDLGTPTWAYVPSSIGQYAMFNDTGFKKGDGPLVSISQTYAGVSAYNDIINMDIDLAQNVTMDGENVDSVMWIKRPIEPLPELTPIDPESITIQPLDPSIIDPIDLGGGDASITSVPPTPSFTDGDWGYEKISSGTAAQIVSYSGAGGGTITIPSTVGGLPVKEIGKGSVSIFDTSITATQLVIPSSVTKIISYAFKDCTGITGELVIPDTVTVIGKQAFQNSGFTGTLIIPSNVTTFQESVFRQCTGLTNIVFPENMTSIPNYTFYGCTGLDPVLTIPDNITNIGNYAFSSIGSSTVILPSSLTNIGTSAFNSSHIKSYISYLDSDVTIGSSGLGSSSVKEILNLGTLELTTTSYGLNLDSVQDHLDAIGFIAPAYFEEVVKNEGVVWDILAVIPLFIAVLLVIGTVTLIAWKR